MWQVFWMSFYRFLALVAVGIVALVVMRLLIRWWAKRAAARELHDEGKRCICGYELAGLAMPRCPECGRAIGFDKTFEEMGINPAELKPKPPRTPSID